MPSSTRPADGRPGTQEVSALRSRLVGQGYTAAQAAAIVATAKTRAQIVADLIALQRAAPRASS